MSLTKPSWIVLSRKLFRLGSNARARTAAMVTAMATYTIASPDELGDQAPPGGTIRFAHPNLYSAPCCACGHQIDEIDAGGEHDQCGQGDHGIDRMEYFRARGRHRVRDATRLIGRRSSVMYREPANDL